MKATNPYAHYQTTEEWAIVEKLLNNLNWGYLYTVNKVGLRCAQDEKFCNGAKGIISCGIDLHKYGGEVNENKTLKPDWTRFWSETLGHGTW